MLQQKTKTNKDATGTSSEMELNSDKKGKDGKNQQTSTKLPPSKISGKGSSSVSAPGRSVFPTPPTSGAEGFNKECLLILREMNSNISKTNDRVEKLSERVDALYEQDTCTEYDYYDDPEYVDIENPECWSIPPPDKRSHGEVEADEDDVFNIFVKKFKKSDIVDKDIKQKLANMINSTFREGMRDESYNDILKTIHRPENCYTLKETRVNAGVWSVLKPQTQTEDSKMRGIQNSVVKASVNLAKLTDKAASTFDEETLE